MTDTPPRIFARPSKFIKSGTTIWLMLHHIRTRLRGKPKQSRIVSVARNLVFLIMFTFACVTVGGMIANALTVLDGNYAYAPYILKAGTILIAFMISLTGSSIMSAYAVFTDREDLDLLLASPLPPQRILASRMLQSAYGALLTATLMGTVAFGYSIINLDVRFALIYPVLIAIMLIALAIGFVVARHLLIWFGLQRGRTIATVLGFTILICGVLSFQLNSMISSDAGNRILSNILGAGFTAYLKEIVTFVGRLAFGQWVETFVLLISAVAAFVTVGALFWNRFASDAARLAGQALPTEKTRRTTRIRFNQGIFFNTTLKEWRCMLRDPFVMVQVATPLVSLIPLGLAVFALQDSASRFDPLVMNAILGFLVVQFGGGIAGTLAWTAASIEEAGDLLLSSPADSRKVFWSKALATAIPSFLFLLIAMSFIAMSQPMSGFLGLLVGSMGLACVGAVEFLRPRPAKRVKMTQRPERSIVSIIMGMVFSLIWAVATAMVIGGMGIWALIPVSIGAAAMVFVWATAPKSVVWMANAPKVGTAGGPWRPENLT